MGMYSQVVIGRLLFLVPSLVGWIVAVVLAAIMLKRGGAKAERFLVIGASLMLLGSFLDIPTPALSMWLSVARGMTNVEAASVLSVFGLVRGCISLAGIICLVYAFWVKFKLHGSVTGSSGGEV